MTYSKDFRQQVLKIRKEEKLSMAKAAKRFGVGKTTIMSWTKNIEAKTTRNKGSTKINMDTLKKDIEMYPDAYQYERATRLGASQTGIWHALNRLKITYKKNPNASQGGSRKKICLLPKAP